MATINSKEFNAAARGARIELKGVFSNPFVVCNLLNKAAKGDFSKIENAANFSRENLSIVAKELKRQHGGRYPFDFDYLKSSSLFGVFDGVLCALHDAADNEVNRNAILHGEQITDEKGRFLAFDENGSIVAVGAPVSLTINGVFNAFCKAAKVDITANEKAAKEAAKEAKKAEKQRAKFEKIKKAVFAVFTADVARLFSDDEIISKYEAIKAATKGARK
jgi:hypothetical protein